MLDAWLDYHRATLLNKCEGLGAEQLKKRSAEPSSLSLLGLVRHMTDVEHHWFRRTLRGEDVAAHYWSEGDPDADFDDLDDSAVPIAFARYLGEVEARRTVAAGLSLDHKSRIFSLRWIYIHMIEEYARHNGHADLLRERIDGATGE